MVRHDGLAANRGWTRRLGRGGAVLGGAVLAGGLAATGLAAAESDLVPGTPCSRTAEACVDLAGGQAWLIHEGVVTHGPVPVSSGAIGEETPTGTFRVEWKHAEHISGESGVPMPYSVFFAPGGIAFHEGDLAGLSAGCVRLGHDDAKLFYETLRVGDDVEVR